MFLMVGGNADAEKWPVPFVSAVIERADGKIFLAKSPKWSNKWVIPGGKVKEGECIEETLVREIRDKTGFEIKPRHILAVNDCVYPKNYYKKTHLVVIHFLCNLVGGSEKTDKKALTDSRWATLEQATNTMDVDEYSLHALKIYSAIKGLADNSVKSAKNAKVIRI